MTPLDRSLFPVTERWTYLNHATICAPPVPVVEAAHDFNLDASRTGGMGFLDRVASVRAVRQRAAGLMGCSPSSVAFTKNTTEALTTVARGLGLGPGDRVVVPTHDFPSTRYPFTTLRSAGVEVVELDPVGDAQAVPVAAVAEAVAAAPTRLVVCSWVQTNRGWRMDVPALVEACHSAGALVCLDLIQGLGVVPCSLEEWGVDLAACGSHKWLLAPEGEGLLYVAPPLIDALEVVGPGWQWFGEESTERAYETGPGQGSTAARFEGGTLNGSGLAGLGAGMGLLLEAGIDSVWAHVDGLCDRLVEGLAAEVPAARVLSERSGAHRSAIVSFAVDGLDAGRLVDSVAQAGFATAARTGAVRVSPHAYNTAAEIDAFVHAVKGWAGRRP